MSEEHMQAKTVKHVTNLSKLPQEIDKRATSKRILDARMKSHGRVIRRQNGYPLFLSIQDDYMH
jgi:hypothetical protein